MMMVMYTCIAQSLRVADAKVGALVGRAVNALKPAANGRFLILVKWY